MNIFSITGNVVNIYDNVKHIKIVVADNYITEQGEQRVNYIPICVFGKRTEFVKRYIKIGDHVQATGKIGTYKSNTGAEHVTLISNDISFCGYKNPHKTVEKPREQNKEQEHYEYYRNREGFVSDEEELGNDLPFGNTDEDLSHIVL